MHQSEKKPGKTPIKQLPGSFDENFDNGLMSNFDHEIDRDIEAYIKGKPLFSRYAGWNFNGKCWWDGDWNCAVWCYGSHVDTITKPTLEEIMEAVCSEYGSD
jgi:hypothetical protein